MPRIHAALVLLLLAPLPVHAEGPPLQPPCGGPSQPAAAAAGRPPVTAVWNEQALRKAGWRPPACLNWTPERTKLAVVLAGDFHFAGTADDLLARLGAFSAYKSIRYWSVSQHGWQGLVSEAGRVGGPDLAASDLVAGSSFDYFENDRAGRTVHRLKVLERTPERVVVASENVTPLRVMLLTAFEPGALQSVTFIDKRGPDLWSCYQIVRAGQSASSMVLGSEASYLNRSAALYRHVAGIPSDRDPPVAP
jgi:hypothetical protein